MVPLFAAAVTQAHVLAEYRVTEEVVEKTHVGYISKQGNKYLRFLIVHGARAVLNNVRDKPDSLSCWIRSQRAKKHKNNATVALANKLVRMAWAILAHGDEYRAALARSLSMLVI